MPWKGKLCALIEGQDNLFASFRNQRNDELALLTPVEQGMYLLAMSRWRHEMMGKFMKEEAEKKKEEKEEPNQE